MVDWSPTSQGWNKAKIQRIDALSKGVGDGKDGAQVKMKEQASRVQLHAIWYKRIVGWPRTCSKQVGSLLQDSGNFALLIIAIMWQLFQFRFSLTVAGQRCYPIL